VEFFHHAGSQDYIANKSRLYNQKFSHAAKMRKAGQAETIFFATQQKRESAMCGGTPGKV
jgi:hypothetical protein